MSDFVNWLTGKPEPTPWMKERNQREKEKEQWREQNRLDYEAKEKNLKILRSSDWWQAKERNRLAAEKNAEQERNIERARRQAAKIATEKKAEQEREQERLCLEIAHRMADERDRLAAEQKAEQERLRLAEIEKARRLAAERDRLAAEQKAEQERLRLAEIEKARRLAAERERLAAEKKAEQERLRLAEIEKARRLAAEQEAEHQRILAEQEAERQRILAEEAKKKTDLRLQITSGTRESIKVALDLIRGKTPLNITDGENRTYLHLAAMMGLRVIVRALLERQVDREIRDVDDNRAIDLAKDDATRQVFLEVPSNQKIYTKEFRTAHNIRDAARETQDPRAKAHLDEAYQRERNMAARRVFSQVNNKVLHESYDLHALETEPAKSIVKKLIQDQRRMANRSGCTRVVTLILGRGNHSTDGNPSINPAIRGMLMKRNIDFHDQGLNDGAIEVRFTPLTTDDTSSVSDSVSTSN